MSSRFLSYPVFRFTLAWAAGILLADKYMVRQEDLCLLGGLFVLGLVGCIGLYFYRSYQWRWLFGGIATATVLCAGGCWGWLRQEQIEYEWGDTGQLYVGQLEEVPDRKRKTWVAPLRVEAVKDTAGNGWRKVNRTILLYWMPDSVQALPTCGDRLLFHAVVTPSGKTDGLPGFDYGHYLKRQGISGTGLAFSGHWRKLPLADGRSFRHRALLCRERLLDSYRSWGLTGEVLAVVSALTVGDKEGLTPELRASYNAAGASHILALSGLHIGLLTILCTGLLYPLRYMKGGRWGVPLLVTALLWLFAFLTGLAPSVVRAVMMFSIYTWVRIGMGGTFTGAGAWSLSALLMLVYNPLYLFDISFQLSFVAVFSILFFYPLCLRLWRPSRKVGRYVWQAMALSLSAQLGTLPLILYYFGTFPTYFLLTNLVVPPLAVCILVFALLALGTSAVPVVGGGCVAALVFFTSLLTGVMTEVQQWAGAQLKGLYLTEMGGWCLGVVLLCAGIYAYQRTFRALCVGLVAVCVLEGHLICRELYPQADRLCFSGAAVMLYTHRKVTPERLTADFCRIRHIRVARFSDDTWMSKSASHPLHLHYAYVCRGFKGSIADLHRCFCMDTLILDRSLSSGMRRRFLQECSRLQLPCVDLSEVGYYMVPL